MAGEVTVPLLPCADVDEISEFYRMLGFRQTYRQLRPNPYVVVQREDIGLHFLDRIGAVALTPADRAALGDALSNADELRRILSAG